MRTTLKTQFMAPVAAARERPLYSKFKTAVENIANKAAVTSSRYLLIASVAVTMSLGGPRLSAQYSQNFDSLATRPAAAITGEQAKINDNIAIRIDWRDEASLTIYNNFQNPVRVEKIRSAIISAPDPEHYLQVRTKGHLIEASAVWGAGPVLYVRELNTRNCYTLSSSPAETKITIAGTNYEVRFTPGMGDSFELSVGTAGQPSVWSGSFVRNYSGEGTSYSPVGQLAQTGAGFERLSLPSN